MAILQKEYAAHTHCHAALVWSGPVFFEKMIHLIRQAEHHIHLQFYIFDQDETGQEILSELFAAAERGVRIYIVMDGYATGKWEQSLLAKCEQHQIQIKWYSIPYLSRFKIGSRMHQKVLVVDEKEALIGGINIANKYSGKNEKCPWLDCAVAVNGEVVKDINLACEQVWKKRLRKRMHQQKPSLGKKNEGDMRIQLLQNNWLLRRIEISRAYKNAIRHSRQELMMVASYFFPGSSIRRHLRNAHRRGVVIQLIVGRFSDVAFFKPASKYLYHWLLKNGIEIYEWQPSVLHGKLAIADDSWVTIGSYNLNALSDYGSLEMNVVIEDQVFAASTKAQIQKLIDEHCVQIVGEEFYNQTHWILMGYRFLCYQVIRLVLKLMFMLSRSKHSKH